MTTCIIANSFNTAENFRKRYEELHQELKRRCILFYPGNFQAMRGIRFSIIILVDMTLEDVKGIMQYDPFHSSNIVLVNTLTK